MNDKIMVNRGVLDFDKVKFSKSIKNMLNNAPIRKVDLTGFDCTEKVLAELLNAILLGN